MSSNDSACVSVRTGSAAGDSVVALGRLRERRQLAQAVTTAAHCLLDVLRCYCAAVEVPASRFSPYASLLVDLCGRLVADLDRTADGDGSGGTPLPPAVQTLVSAAAEWLVSMLSVFNHARLVRPACCSSCVPLLALVRSDDAAPCLLAFPLLACCGAGHPWMESRRPSCHQRRAADSEAPSDPDCAAGESTRRRKNCCCCHWKQSAPPVADPAPRSPWHTQTVSHNGRASTCSSLVGVKR